MNLFNFWRVKVRDYLQDLGILGLRIWLAQEFINAGFTKVSGGWQAPEWFRDLIFPPLLNWLPINANWIIAGYSEIVFGTLLLLGVASRIAALNLLFITWVAVYTVHFDLGFAGWNEIETDTGQGFKVPLMLAIMLLAILTQGGGRYALDTLFAQKVNRPLQLA